jgi:hypothetical protein
VARAALEVFLITCLISGCTSSTNPTYIKEEIDKTIQHICKEEYKLDVKAKLVGETVWIYVPVDDLFVKSDKPEKYIEKFAIEQIKNEFNAETLKFDYAIKPIPEQEKYQEFKFNKAVAEKINNVWKVLRRVIFSLERQKTEEPKFFCLITADIKNGFEIKELFYYLDLKKVSYNFISPGEYQHRSIQDSNVSEAIIGDKEGLHVEYKNITLEDFIAAQIQHRIKLKFQKPEVNEKADIDKEIMKVVVYTIKTYQFRDFNTVELNNLLTSNKITLNQGAVWARPTE